MIFYVYRTFEVMSDGQPDATDRRVEHSQGAKTEPAEDAARSAIERSQNLRE